MGGEEVKGEEVQEVTEEEDEVKGVDKVTQTLLKTKVQDLEVRMEIKYWKMVENILVRWFQWKLKMNSLKQKCPQL